jgi:hypothetical protein
MNQTDAVRVQLYLRQLFGNDRVIVKLRPKDGSAEVYLGQEFVGVMFRDDEEGDVSFSFTMAILEEDLPPAPRGLVS